MYDILMDDFSVYESDFKDCMDNLCMVLTRCEEKHLVLNSVKCHFMVRDSIVLEHKVPEAGIEVDKAKIERSSLGHTGFYKRFNKDVSKIARPLSALLCKNVKFEFTNECLPAFGAIKRASGTSSIDLYLDKKLHYIYYASRTLVDVQKNYATTDKELLVVVFAFDKFRPYLVSSEVIVHTNHSALKYLM
ncbi:hypothetical protein N665_0239s0004 [Sinapis alba]|nr:hypothetical protein N665_0239s0004 [Sinapis alba]